MQEYYSNNLKKEIEEIREHILNEPNMENLEINNLQNIVSLPEEIQGLIHLQKIFVRNCPSLKTIASFEFFNRVKYCTICNSRLKELPLGIEYLTYLKRLNLSKNNFNKKIKWTDLLKFQELESLDLSGSLQKYRGDLPVEIFMLPNLKFLYLSNNSIKHLSLDVKYNHQLIELDLSNNPLHVFPECLTKFKHLKKLTLPAVIINQTPKELFEIPLLEELKISGKNPEKYPKVVLFDSFFRSYLKKRYDTKYIDFMLEIINEPKQIKTFDKYDLIELLKSGINSIVNKALELLEDIMLRESMEDPIMKGSTVVIKGKTEELRGRVKLRLEKNGISLHNNISKSTTHLIVGPGAELSDKELRMLDNLTLLTEKLFFKQLNIIDKPFLEDSDVSSQQINQIRKLLESNDNYLILLGLEIMNSAGSPDELLTDLFILYKTVKDQRIKRETLKFISRISSLEFLNEIKSRKLILVEKNKIIYSDNILYFCEKYHLDEEKIMNKINEKIQG